MDVGDEVTVIDLPRDIKKALGTDKQRLYNSEIIEEAKSNIGKTFKIIGDSSYPYVKLLDTHVMYTEESLSLGPIIFDIEI